MEMRIANLLVPAVLWLSQTQAGKQANTFFHGHMIDDVTTAMRGDD